MNLVYRVSSREAAEDVAAVPKDFENVGRVTDLIRMHK